jgi:hypothetical protein
MRSCSAAAAARAAADEEEEREKAAAAAAAAAPADDDDSDASLRRFGLRAEASAASLGDRDRALNCSTTETASAVASSGSFTPVDAERTIVVSRSARRGAGATTAADDDDDDDDEAADEEEEELASISSTMTRDGGPFRRVCGASAARDPVRARRCARKPARGAGDDGRVTLEKRECVARDEAERV